MIIHNFLAVDKKGYYTLLLVVDENGGDFPWTKTDLPATIWFLTLI